MFDLNPILAANPSIQTLVFPFPSHHSIPPGVEKLKDLGNHGNIPMINALSKLQGEIIHYLWDGDAESVKPESELEFQDLLGASSSTWEQAPSLFCLYREVGGGDPSFEVVKAGMAANRLSWASVFNTFEALEEALTLRLEESGVRFIWAARSFTIQQVADGYGLAPGGSEDWVVGQGLLIKGWAPQMSILSHRVVGGLLGHCEWNSV
ncbi:UDP-glycosyltransferase 89A2-like [Sesamum indicum]|uniref:UDP-glycosyltransferase 89A2-like n=1 Tax=Sesamum indicum TaxID=4182 RepID=A0A6I9USF7_SESIN|nr:UDP-glycosyltransferase 89A2-like [Sesamum indicum]